MFVVIRKSHITLMIVFFITVIAAFFVGANSPKAKLASRNVYGPLNSKVIVIDAGHGGFDPGKTGIKGEHEKDINLAISKKLKKLLEKSGASILMTRTSNKGLYDYDSTKKLTVREKKRQDMKKRVEYATEKGADIFVSVHQNALPPSQAQYYGAQTFYYKKSEEGKKLAESIQETFRTEIKNGNVREIKPFTNESYILRKSSIPAVIVECGFISNPKEEGLLNDSKYQDKVAKCIRDGVVKYFSEK